MLAVFFAIYLIVKNGIYRDIDNDLQQEINDLLTEITVTPQGFAVEQEEWYEKEHNTLNINPIFIQFTNTAGQYSDRSPNLKQNHLKFQAQGGSDSFYNAVLNGLPVRQAQVAVKYKSEIVGYMLVATPLQDAMATLNALQETLLITYPMLLLVLFAVASLLAGSSISPVNSIINTATRISHNNLSARIPYPKYRDELYTLSQTINSLLSRIENAVAREKQFTSHASHELRTPLAVIKGTLEVLVRKPRSQEEFTEKIQYCISELDRINHLVDQLLLLARFESQRQEVKIESTNLNLVFLEAAARNAAALTAKNIKLTAAIPPELMMITDGYLLSVVLDNILSNAVKYSGTGSSITVKCTQGKSGMQLEITDTGFGIAPEDIASVLLPFFRSRPEQHKNSTGSGLGLSIVQRICEMLGIAFTIKSNINTGTTVTLAFAGTA